MARVSDIYGSMVFNEHTMQERLPKATYKQLMRTIKDGTPLDLGIGTTYVGIQPGYGSSVSFVKEEE